MNDDYRYGMSAGPNLHTVEVTGSNPVTPTVSSVARDSQEPSGDPSEPSDTSPTGEGSGEAVELGWVYAVHREDGAIAYVGQTVEFPAVRFRQHMRDAMSGCETRFHRWLRSQVVAGNSPRVSTIETCPYEILTERELWWIRHHHAEQAGATLNTAGTEKMNAPRSPLSEGEVAELTIILRHMQRIAREAAALEARRRAGDAAALAKPAVAAIREVLRRHRKPMHVWEVQLAVEEEFKNSGYEFVPVDELVIATALDRGFVQRGNDKPRYTTLVRLGTLEDRLTDPVRPEMDRVVEYIETRSGGRTLHPADMAAATLIDPDRCEALLMDLGWSRTKRGTWMRPVAERKSA